MLRVKLQFIAVLVWLALIFTVDRLFLHSQPLDFILYVPVLAVSILLVLAPRLMRRFALPLTGLGVVAYVAVFLLLNSADPQRLSSGTFVIGLIMTVGTLLLLLWISFTLYELTAADHKRQVANGILPIAPWLEGEIRINDELNRSRRFEHSVAFVYCTLSRTEKNPVTPEQQKTLLQTIAALTFKSDIVTEFAEGYVVVLPETDRREAEGFMHQVARTLIETANCLPLLGVATYPEDGQMARDLTRVAVANAKVLSAGDVGNATADTYRKGDLLLKPEERLRIERQADWVNKMPEHTPESRKTYHTIKRAIDVGLVTSAIIPALPLMGLVALLIYLDDRQRIFYMQSRTGHAGRRFQMFKFRTMRVGAASIPPTVVVAPDGSLRYMWPEKVENDPRITRVGRILRKTSLDELPQLLNILKGDMSLVGPRPTSWNLDKYTRMQTARLAARPGITGLWQVSARDSTDPDERLLWDMKYIEKASLWLDIVIIWRTVVGVFQKSGV